MSQVVHDTFVIQRTYPATIERVYAAITQDDKKRRWFAEGDGHVVEAFEQDLRIGGIEKLQYRMGPNTPFPGVVLASFGQFHDIVDNTRVVTASHMTLGDRRISASLVTLELAAVGNQTELTCTFQGAYFEGADGPKIRVMGWRHLLERLATVIG